MVLRLVAGVVLSMLTLLFLASIGGGMLYVWWALVPLHWTMARRSGPVGAAWWGVLAGMSLGEVGALLTYVLSGNEAAGVVVGLLLFVGTGVGFVVARSRRVATE